MKWKLAWLILAVILAGLASVPRSVSGEAFGIPNSDKVVDLDIYFPGGEYPQPIRVTVRDGTMLTVINEQTGRTDTWAPSMVSDGAPIFRHFQVQTDAKGDHLTQVEASPVRIALQESEDFSAGWTFQIVNRGVFVGSFPDLRPMDSRGIPPKTLAKIYGKSGSGLCCVSCGGLTICATSVKMDCGYCAYDGGGFRSI